MTERLSRDPRGGPDHEPPGADRQRSANPRPDKARCQVCDLYPHLDPDGRIASHPAWIGHKVATCLGVGVSPRGEHCGCGGTR